eukprot:CAMPEP_0115072202 /NCGR_PEP_ID=MMETSP0227-20121206/14094_1 /TAXON_ID=89957 /ORGANISM="Polarella glacialis, Strain CCMP 1383" /LENGTH=45 /DNA_ID= /DNA_START= /DNA_END= /DNA_ORIENTATION=
MASKQCCQNNGLILKRIKAAGAVDKATSRLQQIQATQQDCILAVV